MAHSDAKKIFTRIYARNSWRDAESKSGPGSTAGRTCLLRSRLSELVSELGIRSLLDVPCGDFNWMRLMELPGVEYLGADVVAELVRANTLLYGGPGRKFVEIDMLRDPLPQADLVLCRDGLVHLSFSDIASALPAIKESQATWLLTTTFTACARNIDVPTGDWRPLNLDLPPFRFPPALRLVPDGPRPDGTYPDKVLALYRVEDLPDRLLSTPAIAAWKRAIRKLSGVTRRTLERMRHAYDRDEMELPVSCHF